MIKPLRVGIIGCGAAGQIMHIPYAMEYEHFEVVALSDRYEPVLDAVADRYRIDNRYTDWREMIARDDIEAVIICHSGSHRDSVIESIDAGKHVFVEKPVTMTISEAKEVAAHVNQSDRIVQAGYHKRYDPAYQYTKTQVDNMQDIGFVRVTVLHPPNEMGLSVARLRRGNGIFEDGHMDVISWQEQVENQLHAFAGGESEPLVDEVLGETRKNDKRLRLGYGVISTSIIHQIYMIYGFLGRPTRVLHTDIWRDGLSINTLLEYPNDLRCSIDWHFLSQVKDYREEYSFYGNHERVSMQLPSPYLKNAPSPVIVQGGDGELAWEKRVIVSYDEAFRNELLAFYDNVQNNTTPETDVNEALIHAEMMQDIIDAAT